MVNRILLYTIFLSLFSSIFTQNTIDKCRLYSNQTDTSGNKLCILCEKGHAPAKQNLPRCDPCDKECVTCVFNPSFCFNCKEKHVLLGTSCMPCMDGCDKCTHPISCDLCGSGYYLNPLSKCAQCSSGCAECKSGLNCAKCKEGFSLFSEASGTNVCRSNKPSDPSKPSEPTRPSDIKPTDKENGSSFLPFVWVFLLLVLVTAVGAGVYIYIQQRKSRDAEYGFDDPARDNASSFYGGQPLVLQEATGQTDPDETPIK